MREGVPLGPGPVPRPWARGNVVAPGLSWLMVVVDAELVVIVT